MRKGSTKAAAPLGLSLALAALLLIRIVWDGAAHDAVPVMESEDPPPVAEEMAELMEAPGTITLPPPPMRELPVAVVAPAPEPVPESPPPVEAALPPTPAPAPALDPLRPRAVAEAAPMPQAAPESVDAPTPLQPPPPSEPVAAAAPGPPAALRSQPQPAPPLTAEPAEATVEATVADAPRPLAPEPASTPTPVPSNPPVHVANPAPVPPAVTAPPTPDPVADETVLAEGRPLLRILEHGSGPVIEIAWPDGQVARERLYETFTTCFGMRVALMDRNGTLFAAEGRAGAAWAVNLDRYSGFVRQPAGRLARAEMHEAERALAHHGAGLRASPVRIFPRRVDALLLGGLRRIAGARYRGAARIRATYELEGRRVFVTGINVDGRPVAGRIDLSLASLARCR